MYYLFLAYLSLSLKGIFSLPKLVTIFLVSLSIRVLVGYYGDYIPGDIIGILFSISWVELLSTLLSKEPQPIGVNRNPLEKLITKVENILFMDSSNPSGNSSSNNPGGGKKRPLSSGEMPEEKKASLNEQLARGTTSSSTPTQPSSRLISDSQNKLENVMSLVNMNDAKDYSWKEASVEYSKTEDLMRDIGNNDFSSDEKKKVIEFLSYHTENIKNNTYSEYIKKEKHGDYIGKMKKLNKLLLESKLDKRDIIKKLSDIKYIINPSEGSSLGLSTKSSSNVESSSGSSNG